MLDSTAQIGNYSFNGNTPYFPAEVAGAGQSNCNQYGLNCLNAAGFSSANNLTVFPNQGRNQFRGPGFFDSDLSVNKNFKLTERVNFGLGANLYNIFNHPNFASPVNTWTGTGPRLGTSVRSCRPRLRRPVRTDHSSQVCLRDASFSSRARLSSRQSRTDSDRRLQSEPPVLVVTQLAYCCTVIVLLVSKSCLTSQLLRILCPLIVRRF